MATNLTNEQRIALERHENRPVPVVDPVSNAMYYLVPSEVFERFQDLFNCDGVQIQKSHAMQATAAGKAGWDDPAMDVYDNYDAHKK